MAERPQPAANPAERERTLGIRILEAERTFFDALAQIDSPFDASMSRGERQDRARTFVQRSDTPQRIKTQWRHLDNLRWSLAGCGASLIRHARRRWRRQGSADDLEATAWLALYRAACLWDPHQGTRFSTYARWAVRSAVNETADSEGRLVRVPTSARRKLSRLDRARAEGLSLNEAAEETGVRSKEARRLSLQASGSVMSLYAQDASGQRLIDRLGETTAHPAELYERKRRRLEVRSALDRLDERDRTLLTQRFGLSSASKTFRELGDELGVSGERARQVCARAAERLKALMA